MTGTFTVPFAWINRQVFFRLGWVSRAYELWINGRKVGYDANGNNPAEYNITKYVEEGRNRVEIVAAERPQRPAGELEELLAPGGRRSLG